jgi:nucleotide-binding universal stress UspA family protein
LHKAIRQIWSATSTATASSEVVEVGERSAAEAISHRAQTYQADCLVMGAFGHSRLRDFILGGVTQYMLAYPPLPVFLSF